MRIKISERELLDPGYRRSYVPTGESVEKLGESRLRELKKGQRIKPKRLQVRRHGLTEAGLIGRMRDHAIGRPATYAIVMESLLQRKYMECDQSGRLVVTEIGKAVLNFLLSEYPDLFSLEFTAKMETWLDEVSGGKKGAYERTMKALAEILTCVQKKI